MFRATWARRVLQLGFLGAVIWLALGRGTRGFEAFCPFGGAEAAWSLFREQTYTCALSEMNVAMLLGVLGLTVIAGKAFCSWVCPIGFMNELLGHLRLRIPGVRSIEVPSRLDRRLRLLRYVFLALMLVLTWKAGELILRGYDPFYLIFSGFGHGSLGLVSWISLSVIVLGALVVPMLWCRYLCPMGALMDALARFGILRIQRAPAGCTSCGACDRACLQGLAVSTPETIAHIDCTRCLDCVDACSAGTLDLRLGPPWPQTRRPSWRKVTAWAIPLLVVGAVFAGVRAAEPLTLPTATAEFEHCGPLEQPAVATFSVTGVKCRGTANLLIRRLSGSDGVASVEAFAGMGRVAITFDQARISPEALRDTIDAPVRHPRTGELFPGVFTCTSMKVRS